MGVQLDVWDRRAAPRLLGMESMMDSGLPIQSELFQVEIQEAYQLLARTVDELVAKFGRAQ